MTALKPTYPLYLANEARQPNTDLAVTDKFTGEVATRVALADADTIAAMTVVPDLPVRRRLAPGPADKPMV